MSKYFKENDKIFVAPNGAKEIFDNLPADIYIVRHGQLSGFYLERSSSFTVPEKIFGDIEKKVQRIFKTYTYRNCNTGVLLSGDKGSGKTMLARLLSIKAIEMGIPTVIINSNFDNDIGLNKFLSNIEDRCIVLFDEFEKVFDKDEDQNKILTLLDGTYQSNKLFVFTVNNVHEVSEFLLNRPSRVFYHFKYSGIEDSFIREFCEYHLENKSYIEDFVNLSKFVGCLNFDMLQSIVLECNIHKESPRDVFQNMNVEINKNVENFKYTFTVKETGEEIIGEFYRSIYETIYMNYNNSNNEMESILFKIEDITDYDSNTGKFTFEKNGFKLELIRLFKTKNILQF